MSRPDSRSQDRPQSSRQASQAGSSRHDERLQQQQHERGTRQDGPPHQEGANQQREQDQDSRRPRPPPLPAVKGTIGGIESPRRSHLRNSPSLSTVGGDPLTPSTIVPQQNGHTAGEQRRQPNPDAPVFRIDPNLRTTFDSLNMDAKDEIKRLFGVA